ncbi:hypothetical protein ACOMHN_022698 [Nucella lapillus]
MEDQESSIHFACHTGDVQKLQQLVIEGQSVESKDVFGQTPLFWACAVDKTEIIHELSVLNADFNAVNNAGIPVLHRASMFNSPDTVDNLLIYGADVQKRNPQGDTVLHTASVMGNFPVVDLLLRRTAGALVNVKNGYYKTPLLDIIDCKHEVPWKVEIIKRLLFHGADVNIPCDETLITPLHSAAAEDNQEIMELLLKSSPNVNTFDRNGYTPLHISIFKESPLVPQLLAAGGQVNAVDFNTGETALFSAARNGYLQYAILLLKQNIDIFKTNYAGVTAKQEAAAKHQWRRG